ncbi:hypothetical protein EMIHUDRAFT_197520 [Emiliania huxleyi CCMP1516]|uniref:Sas10 C-terminal domain-containing protein n=2 Tax=Emiliania huxleyi TaxID=2903 RepID=A0A0D3IUF5_EMIH1|nr:hypothetical protein EMIHUDRAFT_197520 [Emiliania huxleyi CCMP1516]EOD14890.1 hypothetical protein EMIHUDRAFT_197520 [Emiliania huxleyi CCMP1516]|eukprot:XP_005767319.1 hypothetical protein EMIHUDRAFT_197520 [Emiliania huxleyi CCMP1516]
MLPLPLVDKSSAQRVRKKKKYLLGARGAAAARKGVGKSAKELADKEVFAKKPSRARRGAPNKRVETSVGNAFRLVGGSDDDEEAQASEDEMGEEEDASRGGSALGAGWGRKKNAFYGGDDAADADSDEEGSMDEEDEGRAERLEHAERLERDLSALSEAEKARLLEAEAPELVSLLDDFKAIVPDVRERLEPLLLAVRQRQLPASPGVALLQLKLQLLLSYCTNIAFYLLLKASGRPAMRYRVQKLLQTAADGATAAPTDADADELRHKPNPQALLADGDLDDDAAGAGGGGGVYKPPRLAAVPYEEERGAGRRERQRERAVRELREEFSSAPRQIHADDFGCGHAADSAAVSKLRHEEAEVRAYEEANFSRLALSKEQKRELRRRHAAVERGDELSQFDDDFSHLYSAGDMAGDGDKREAGRQIMKNRGLTRERKKIDRNPRAKNREKYRRAVIKRKGQVRDAKAQEGAYGGESSGINQNLAAGLAEAFRFAVVAPADTLECVSHV